MEQTVTRKNTLQLPVKQVTGQSVVGAPRYNVSNASRPLQRSISRPTIISGQTFTGGANYNHHIQQLQHSNSHPALYTQNSGTMENPVRYASAVSGISRARDGPSVDENNINPYCSTATNIVPYTFPFKGMMIQKKAKKEEKHMEQGGAKKDDNEQKDCSSSSSDTSDSDELVTLEKRVPTMLQNETYEPLPSDMYRRVAPNESITHDMIPPYDSNAVRTWVGMSQIYNSDGLLYEEDLDASDRLTDTAYAYTTKTDFSMGTDKSSETSVGLNARNSETKASGSKPTKQRKSRTRKRNTQEVASGQAVRAQ